jgi:hypothetical protein
MKAGMAVFLVRIALYRSYGIKKVVVGVVELSEMREKVEVV